MFDFIRLFRKPRLTNMKENYIDFMKYSSDKFTTKGIEFKDFITKMAADFESHFDLQYDDLRKMKFDKIAKENPTALTGAFKHLIFQTSAYFEFCTIVQNYALKAYGTHVQAKLNVGNSLLILFKRSKREECASETQA